MTETPNQKYQRERHEESMAAMGRLYVALRNVEYAHDEVGFRLAIQSLCGAGASLLGQMQVEEAAEFKRRYEFTG